MDLLVKIMAVVSIISFVVSLLVLLPALKEATEEWKVIIRSCLPKNEEQL